MACEYCKNKSKNKPLVESPDRNEGVMVCIEKHGNRAQLMAFGWFAFGWFDALCGIEAQRVEINYCPMCGAKVVEG